MARHVLILSFDRLHLGYLGCYGNEWVETPHLDGLAARGITFDRHFADDLDPATYGQSWWTGQRRAADLAPATERPLDLSDALRQAGVGTCLVTEAEPDGAEPPRIAPGFDEIHHVTTGGESSPPESEFPFARLIRKSLELAAESPDDKPSLLWIRSSGVPLPWLPPRELMDLYLEEFGLEGAALAESSPTIAEDESLLDADDEFGEDVFETEMGAETGLDEAAWQQFDARELGGSEAADDRLADDDTLGPTEDEELDELHSHRALMSIWEEEELAEQQQAEGPLADIGESLDGVDLRYARALYAAYVTHLDRWIGKLLAGLPEKLRGEDALIVVAGALGEDLAEHGPLGTQRHSLLEEITHTPLLAWTGQLEYAATRRPALVQPVDLPPTLCEWFGVAPPAHWHGRSWLPVVRGETESIHETLLVGSPGGDAGLYTDDFLFVKRVLADSFETALHERPFDRWGMVDMSRNYSDEVETLEAELARQLAQFESAP